MQENPQQSKDTSIKSRLKAIIKKYKKPFGYALLAALPFVILWVVVVWLLARCQ